MNTIDRLQKWYLSECNGDWEHAYGVRIDTLDNPGWFVEIDLHDTSLARQPFKKLSQGVGADRIHNDGEWLVCSVEDDKFKGYGGPQKLDHILTVFLDWAEGHMKP